MIYLLHKRHRKKAGRITDEDVAVEVQGPRNDAGEAARNDGSNDDSRSDGAVWTPQSNDENFVAGEDNDDVLDADEELVHEIDAEFATTRGHGHESYDIGASDVQTPGFI